MLLDTQITEKCIILPYRTTRRGKDFETKISFRKFSIRDKHSNVSTVNTVAVSIPTKTPGEIFPRTIEDNS